MINESGNNESYRAESFERIDVAGKAFAVAISDIHSFDRRAEGDQLRAVLERSLVFVSVGRYASG